MDWILLAVGGAIGFAASLAATYTWNALARPNLEAGELLYDDVTYHVQTMEGSETERRIPIPKLIPVDPTGTVDIRLPPGLEQRDLTWYSINVRNAPRKDPIRRRFARQMAWAASARLDFKQFNPGQNRPVTGARHFQFVGRWGSTPEPSDTPKQLEIRRGQVVDIPHGRDEGLNLAVKYEGDESAWGFTNDSYYYHHRRRGLWRHPDFELPLATHFRVSITVESSGSAQSFYYHFNNRGPSRRDLTIHSWGACSECATLDAKAV